MSEIILHIAGKKYSVDTENEFVSIDGKHFSIDFKEINKNEYSVLVNGRSYHVFASKQSDHFSLHVKNHYYDIQQQSLRDELSEKFFTAHLSNHTAITFKAPMPGLVTKVLKAEGSAIEIGEGVVVVEAMKMENEIKSSKKGTVTKLFIKEKQTVEKGDRLFTIE